MLGDAGLHISRDARLNNLTRDVTDCRPQVPLMDDAGVYTVPEPQQKPGKGDWKHENLMTSITKV